MTVSVFVLVEFRARPERVDDLLEILARVLPGTRAFDGCHQVLVEQDLDEPTAVLLCERWESRDHFSRYRTWRRQQGDMDGVGEFLTGRPSTRYFGSASAVDA
jgi:quinol monooxygenase YgiN